MWYSELHSQLKRTPLLKCSSTFTAEDAGKILRSSQPTRVVGRLLENSSFHKQPDSRQLWSYLQENCLAFINNNSFMAKIQRERMKDQRLTTTFRKPEVVCQDSDFLYCFCVHPVRTLLSQVTNP